MKLGVDLDVFEEDDLDDDDAADDYDRSATKYHMSRGEEYHNVSRIPCLTTSNEKSC